jgi:hypothetical protein
VLSRLALGFLLLATADSLAGDKIKVYRVPKEKPLAQGLPAGHPGMAAAGHPAEPKLSWKTPDGWNEVPPGEMRKASFNVKTQEGKQADVSVIPLAGAAGGDAANVNRWRGQVALPVLAPDELKKTAEAVTIASQPAELYDVSGTNTSSGEPVRILGVILHREGTAWFFKMTGDDQLVAQQKPAFVEFLKSFDFASGEAPATLPAGHPEVASTPAPAGAPTRDGQPTWQPPQDWKEVPGGQFLVAKFLITGAGNAQAAVNVSMSPGDGGGLAGNVNRWRAQLGLPPLAAGELEKAVTPLKLGENPASLVEMTGTDAKIGGTAKLIGAIVPQGGRTWFYKLMGNPAVVDSQQAAFKEFLQTVKY